MGGVCVFFVFLLFVQVHYSETNQTSGYSSSDFDRDTPAGMYTCMLCQPCTRAAELG